jgi:hypothetical protein
MQGTEAFPSRACKGSVSTMMGAITRWQELSRGKSGELHAILRQADADRH